MVWRFVPWRFVPWYNGMEVVREFWYNGMEVCTMLGEFWFTVQWYNGRFVPC